MDLVHKQKRSLTLFTGLDTTAFAVVLVVVVFTLWIVDNAKPMVTRGVSVDPPYVSRPASMPGALREDAMQIMITRDGNVYFGSDQINVINLPAEIQDRLNDRGVERKVYITADMRARWINVKTVLEDVRSTGIIRVAFLVSPHPPPIAKREAQQSGRPAL
jgi:biopolymer transport protein TolR